MAAQISKNVIQVTRKHNIFVASFAVQRCEYSTEPIVFKNPTTAKLRQGTGGRSSFNGIVCTVFGNTGYIGHKLVSHLGKVGTQLILPYRGDEYSTIRMKVCGDLGQIWFNRFELKDEESIVKSIRHSNVVVNLIGKDFETPNYSFNEVHVEGARRLARLSKECGVERFIQVTPLSARPNPPPLILAEGSKNLKSRWVGEQAVKEEFPNATIVRLADAYGLDDKFICRYINPYRYSEGAIPLWEKGDKTLKRPVYVDDVCRGLVELVSNPRTAGKTYQFAGPKQYKLGDIVDWINNIVYKKSYLRTMRYERTNIKEAYIFNLKIKFLEAIAPRYPMEFISVEAIEKEHHSDHFDTSLPTLEDLGITPAEMEKQMVWYVKPYRYEGKSHLVLTHYDPVPEIESVPLPTA